MYLENILILLCSKANILTSADWKSFLTELNMYVFASQDTQGWKKQNTLCMLLTKKNHCPWAACHYSSARLVPSSSFRTAGPLDGSHVLFVSHYHFLPCPIWLPICLALSTQYISIAPLLPWQISECWYLFPWCSSSCTNSAREKKSFQLLKLIL